MSKYKIQHYPIVMNHKKFFGVFLLPESQKSFPVVIICHGFGGSYQDNMNYAIDLANHGIASYLFDFCGGSLKSQSSNFTTEMSVVTELQDLLEVVQVVRTMPFVNQNQLFLFGESQGGLVCALAASILKTEITGLILLYPAFNIPDNARSEYTSINLIPLQFGLWGIPLGQCYYKDIYQMDVFQDISQYLGDVLIFHGSHDEIVPIEYSKKAAHIYNKAQLQIIDYVGHGFYGPLANHISQKIVQFIKNILK